MAWVPFLSINHSVKALKVMHMKTDMKLKN